MVEVIGQGGMDLGWGQVAKAIEDLDKLITYDAGQAPDTTRIINPQYRHLEGETRKNTSQLNRVVARFGNLALEGDIYMLACRVETAMAHTLREKLPRTDDARALLRAVYIQPCKEF